MKTENYGEEAAKVERRQMFYKLNMIPWLLLVTTLFGIVYYLIKKLPTEITPTKGTEIIAENHLGNHLENNLEKGNLIKPPIGGLINTTNITPKNLPQSHSEFAPSSNIVTYVENRTNETSVVTLVHKLSLSELELSKVNLKYKGLQEEIVRKEYGKWEKKGEEMELVILDVNNIFQRVELEWWKIKDVIIEMEKIKEENKVEGDKLLESFRWLFAMNTITNAAGVARFRYTPENHTFARSIGYDLEMDIIDNIKAICDNEGIKLPVVMQLSESIKRSFRGFEIMNNLKKGK